MSDTAAASVIHHASCVAWSGRAALMIGRAGSGKSGLALQLMAYGCDLVSDDRTILTGTEQGLIAAPPDTIAGMIEARGLGLLAARNVARAAVALCVDLDQIETARLPPERSISLCGIAVPLVHRCESPHFHAAILQYLRSGPSS